MSLSVQINIIHKFHFLQVPFLTEAITTCVLLLKLSAADASLEDRVTPLWNSALNLQKGYFTSEKFLTQTSEEGKLRNFI